MQNTITDAICEQALMRPQQIAIQDDQYQLSYLLSFISSLKKSVINPCRESGSNSVCAVLCDSGVSAITGINFFRCWRDSMRATLLVALLEEEFGVSCDITEFSKNPTVGGVMQYLSDTEH